MYLEGALASFPDGDVGETGLKASKGEVRIATKLDAAEATGEAVAAAGETGLGGTGGGGEGVG